MTREQTALRLDGIMPYTDNGQEALTEAAALLRQTCNTCEHFNVEGVTGHHVFCYAPSNWVQVPGDGSGFCHRWEPKL